MTQTAQSIEPQTINATDLRTRTRDLLEQVKWRGAVYQVMTFGQPTAITRSVSVKMYKQLRAQVDAAAEDEATSRNLPGESNA